MSDPYVARFSLVLSLSPGGFQCWRRFTFWSTKAAALKWSCRNERKKKNGDRARKKKGRRG